MRWRTEGGNEAAAASVSGAKGRRRRHEGGKMGRLEHLRPACIAKRMGPGAGEVILPPSRARIRRGTLSWSATTAKVVKISVENGRERSGKCLNHFRSHIFWPGTGTGTGRPDGKTNPVLRDIGNRIFQTGTCRLRSGSGNTKREHRYI